MFTVFTKGAADGLQVVLKLLPTLCGLLCAVEMLKASGVLDFIATLLSPVTERIGIPADCLPLFLLRPFSGSASLALAGECIASSGADSLPGRIAAVLMASSETTFYTAAVYSAASGLKPARYTLFCALLGDLTAMLVSVQAVKWLFS
ncbi:MAG: spore maturation protein [Clostridia bacterium]|nr:spore maturation protein [Clostridia bacterium]